MYDDLLVPTDGGDHADRAAAHAGYLAERFDATVHVLGVVDVRAAAGAFDAGGVDEAFVDDLRERARAAVDAVADSLTEGGRGDRVRTAVERGAAAETILEYVDDRGVDLVAMGTHGRRGVERLVTGSVTERVVRLSDVPVVTTRAVATDPPDYDEVLLATDGSAGATAALDHAVAVAAATDARLHALGVVDVTGVGFGPEYTVPSDVLGGLESVVHDAVADAVDRAEARGLAAVGEVRQGTPARGILDYAEAAGVDLVAVGTAGRTGLGRILLGSTAERVVRRSTPPVLTVRRPERE